MIGFRRNYMPVYKISSLLDDSRQFRHHLLKVSGIFLLIAAVVAYFFDQKVSMYFSVQGGTAEMIRIIAREVTNIGLSQHYFIMSVGVWFLCAFITPRIAGLKKYASGLDYLRRWGLNFLVALLVSGAITHIIKFLVGRQRPHKSPVCDPFTFDPFTHHWHWHSFSSGHSQVMAVVAFMFTIAMPRYAWFWILIAITACGTRVAIQDHFLSDVIFGACVGYCGTLIALKWMRKSKNALV